MSFLNMPEDKKSEIFNVCGLNIFFLLRYLLDAMDTRMHTMADRLAAISASSDQERKKLADACERVAVHEKVATLSALTALDLRLKDMRDLTILDEMNVCIQANQAVRSSAYTGKEEGISNRLKDIDLMNAEYIRHIRLYEDILQSLGPCDGPTS